MIAAHVEALPFGAASPVGLGHLALEVKGKRFAYVLDNHHGNARLAINAKMAKGVQDALVSKSPERFHVPAYVGKQGWVGLWIDLPAFDWSEVEDLLNEAYRLRAPAKIAGLLEPGALFRDL